MGMVNRSQRLAFMDIGEKYTRMTKFTSLSGAKNPKEYSRTYVDETTETSDVIGYAPSTDYSFDRYTDNAVQDIICNIHDNELIGTDTHVDIVSVDLFSPEEADNSYKAVKRTWAVIPSSEGDGTDALIYSGSFKAVSAIVSGVATMTDATNQTLTFVADTDAEDEVEATAETPSA